MVLQQLVSWVQNSQSVNIHSMSPSKTEQADGRTVRCSLNPEAARTTSHCRNLTAQLLSISEAHAQLQTSVMNLTELNLQLVYQSEELASNNTHLTSINRILSLEAALHQEIISNLTENNQQLREENGRLTVLSEVFADERDNMSVAIGVLERQNDNLTKLYLREKEKEQAIVSSNTNLRRELRESADNNTLLWAQSQQLLDQNVLLQSENLKLNETVGQIRAQQKKCQREWNLADAQEHQIRFQNQNLTKEIALLSNSVQHLHEQFSSLDHYCPVVNQTTQERRCRSCDDGWRLFRSKCYFLSSDSGGWAHARSQCQSQGAELLIIDSQEEQSFVFAMSMMSGPKGRAWVGMTDMKTEGEWRWVDGRLVRDSVQYWLKRADGSSEPDDWQVSNKEGGEDCGHLDTAETEFSCWMDGPCNAPYRWICEKAL
ncbi:hypothetical protein ACEWY4_025995 [Coilia grayii]|uniref:C-type lectin domain-containing protein n=1 Tax=Coilia grayii TaxID=363190 RepID=A0ABD1IVN4_9TELE